MNKYEVIIPYDCAQYGEMSCFVYAENEEDAIDLAQDRSNWSEEEYEDGDQDNFTYDYESLRITIHDENVTAPVRLQTNHTNNNFNFVSYSPNQIPPDYFLAELHLV